MSPKRSVPEASASKNPATYATACRPRSAIKADPSWSTSWSTGTRWPRPAHVPGKTVAGFTLSLARQALHGQMDEVIATARHNVRLL